MKEGICNRCHNPGVIIPTIANGSRCGKCGGQLKAVSNRAYLVGVPGAHPDPEGRDWFAHQHKQFCEDNKKDILNGLYSEVKL